MTSYIRRSQSIRAFLLCVLMSACQTSDLQSDRFIAAINEGAGQSATEVSFLPNVASDYAIVLLPKGPIAPELLRSAGLEGPRLQGALEAAPAEFESAIIVVTPTHFEMGWFLGHYALVQAPAVVNKRRGQPVTVGLRYGASLPLITSIR